MPAPSMSLRDRLKAAAAFGLAYLSTPSSRAGIVAILVGLGVKSVELIDAIYTWLLVGAGAALVMWPERPKP